MLYLAFATVLPLTTRSTCSGTALRDVRRLRLDLSDVELGVHGRVVHVVLGELLWTLLTTVYSVPVDGDAVCATALLGYLAHACRLHERWGRGCMTRVGK